MKCLTFAFTLLLSSQALALPIDNGVYHGKSKWTEGKDSGTSDISIVVTDQMISVTYTHPDGQIGTLDIELQATSTPGSFIWYVNTLEAGTAKCDEPQKRCVFTSQDIEDKIDDLIYVKDNKIYRKGSLKTHLLKSTWDEVATRE